MEKLIHACMANPTRENFIKMFAYARKHTMATCLLPENLMTIFNQYKREHPTLSA